ncbi:hypothetical protein [Micromonospora kangleipakensis]|nr:hypothetical protein [Micromonospora kangleipakensis]
MREAVDWSRWLVRVGAYYCPEHSEVRPRDELVPACPHRLRAAHLGALVGKELTTVEVAPRTCAGAPAHPLGSGQVLLGTWACSCAPDGVHRTWTCRACGDVQH